MQSQIENLNNNLKLQTELTNQKENILNKIIMEIHDCIKNKVTLSFVWHYLSSWNKKGH